MGSHRAARPSRRAGRAVLVLGAVVVGAGAGATLAALDGRGDGHADRVAGRADTATPAAGEAPDRTTPAPASPSSSPASPSPSVSPSRTAGAPPARAGKTAPRPTRTAAPTAAATPTATGSAPAPATTGAATPRPAESAAARSAGPEAQVLALVNEERAAAGCAPLTADDRLTRAADAYSDAMAGSGVLSHTGPDGSTMASRVEAAGYAWSALGENIARGQADAASVMESWMNSPGHRANILNCSFTHLGVGVHPGDGGPWWTQDFGTGR
ncbi:CAP domain-containing protein [Streptomyces fumanus]|uniref:CAP domain-containing protein n=1 Tax=Streptomyces fumanus TaxID=67302 RepID=UPI0033DB5692